MWNPCQVSWSDPFCLVLSNTHFVCGFVLLPWNFPLGCSKATLSAPCFFLRPSTPLANTVWAEGLALLGWRVERCCGGASPRPEARLPLVRNRFGGQGIPSVRGYTPMPLYPFAMPFLTAFPITLLFVSLVAKESSGSLLFEMWLTTGHWVLGRPHWYFSVFCRQLCSAREFENKKGFCGKYFHGHSAMPPGECHSGQQSGQNVLVFSGFGWWIRVLHCQCCCLNSVESYSLWGDFPFPDRLLNLWKFRRRKKVATRKENFEEEGNLFWANPNAKNPTPRLPSRFWTKKAAWAPFHSRKYNKHTGVVGGPEHISTFLMSEK